MTEAEMQAIERAWEQHHDDLFPLCPCHSTVLQVIDAVRDLHRALGAIERGERTATEVRQAIQEDR